LGGGEAVDGQTSVLRAAEMSVLCEEDQRHDDEASHEVGQRQRHDEQVSDGVTQTLVQQSNQYESAVAEYHENGKYRQHHVLQRQLIVGEHLACWWSRSHQHHTTHREMFGARQRRRDLSHRKSA